MLCPFKMAENVDKHVELLLTSNKNANLLVDLLALLDEKNDGPESFKCCRGITKVFEKHTRERIWQSSSKGESEEPTDSVDVKDVFGSWIFDKYKSFITILLTKLKTGSNNLKSSVIKCFLILVKAEYYAASLVKDSSKIFFPHTLFLRFIKALFSPTRSNLFAIKYYSTHFMRHDDLKYFTLRHLNNHMTLISKKKSGKQNQVFANNVYEFLKSLKIPTTDEDVNKGYMECDEEKNFNKKDMQREYSSLWFHFLGQELPVSLQRKVLLNLDTKVMPYLADPKLLIDYLTQCYNTGGVTSILSLNGLFVLISKYNLEYPDFYVKLYSLLQPNIMHVKYRSRFLYLLDIFLTSSHLPNYLVAAFVKKLTRLCLTSPCDAMYSVLPLILNLLRRHPSCKVLIHRRIQNGVDTNEDVESTEETEKYINDPFNEFENDPVESNALLSSLWELESLSNHYNPDVIDLVQKFKQPIERSEVDVTDALDIDADDVLEKELIDYDEGEDVPMAFVEPQTIA